MPVTSVNMTSKYRTLLITWYSADRH